MMMLIVFSKNFRFKPPSSSHKSLVQCVVSGIEVLLKLLTMQDFHIYGHVALPIQYLNRAMVTAKRGSEEVQLPWNYRRYKLKLSLVQVHPRDDYDFTAHCALCFEKTLKQTTRCIAK